MANLKFSLKDPNTNWKYLLIVIILGFIVGGGILGYWYWLMSQKEIKIPEVKAPEEVSPEEIPPQSITKEPIEITLIGNYKTKGGVTAIFVLGNYAYIPGLQILDVSNPANPTLVGSYETSGYTGGLYVSNQYAYIIDGWSFKILDISNPTHPTLIGSYEIRNLYGFGTYVSNSYAYIADGETGLKILDISNPANPILVGSYEYKRFPPGEIPEIAINLYVSDNYAYVVGRRIGLQIFDISNPTNPTLVGSYKTSGTALEVYVFDRYAYISGYFPPQVIDISNPANPTLVGSYEDKSICTRGGMAVSLSNKLIYFTYETGATKRDPSGFRIIDVSNPANPTLVGSYETSGGGGCYAIPVSGIDLTISDNYVYIADGERGLQIFEIKYK